MTLALALAWFKQRVLGSAAGLAVAVGLLAVSVGGLSIWRAVATASKNAAEARDGKWYREMSISNQNAAAEIAAAEQRAAEATEKARQAAEQASATRAKVAQLEAVLAHYTASGRDGLAIPAELVEEMRK